MLRRGRRPSCSRNSGPPRPPLGGPRDNAGSPLHHRRAPATPRPPLPAPRRGQGGEPGFCFWCSGQASMKRGVATVAGRRTFLGYGRSKGQRYCVPTTAAAARPAVSEKRRSGARTAGLVAGRRSRQPWRPGPCAFSTTAGAPVEASEDDRDLPRRSSVAGDQKPNQGSPLCPRRGAERGGGESGGEDRCPARGKRHEINKEGQKGNHIPICLRYHSWKCCIPSSMGLW